MNGDVFLLQQPKDRLLKALTVSVAAVEGGFTLRNAGPDARSIADFLRKCGFGVAELTEPTAKELSEAVADIKFGGSMDSAPNVVPPNTLVVFFFAGNGLFVRGRNYVVPKDSKSDSPDSVEQSGIEVGQLCSQLRSKSAASIVVLDTGFTDIYPKR
jgi:uncharacterized caspase-like protein